MPTPDRTPGPSLEEETQYEDRGPGGDNDGDPTIAGALRRLGDELRYKESSAVAQVLKARGYPAGFKDVDLTGVLDGDALTYEASSKTIKPGAGGGGLTAGGHRLLDQLVHDISEDSFEEYVYTGNRVDSIIVWETAAKLKKIRETVFTYTGNQATTIVTKQYDGAGALITGETQTETLAYTGGKLDDITRVMT